MKFSVWAEVTAFLEECTEIQPLDTAVADAFKLAHWHEVERDGITQNRAFFYGHVRSVPCAFIVSLNQAEAETDTTYYCLNPAQAGLLEMENAPA